MTASRFTGVLLGDGLAARDDADLTVRRANSLRDGFCGDAAIERDQRSEPGAI